MALTPGEIVASLMQAGLTRAAAAGIAGNAMQESSDNPGDAGGNLFQWQGDRQSALQSYASKHGLSPNSAQANLGYLIQDLNGPYSGLKAQLNKAGSAGDAAVLFEQQYERAGIPMNQNRIKYAQQAAGQSGKAVTGTASQPGNTTTTETTKFTVTPGKAQTTTFQSPVVSDSSAGTFNSLGTMQQNLDQQRGVNAASDPVAEGWSQLASMFSNAPTVNSVTATTTVPGLDGVKAATEAHVSTTDPVTGVAAQGGGLAKVLNLAQRAVDLENQKGIYKYTQDEHGAGDSRTNLGKGVLSQVNGAKISFDCSGFIGALYKYAGLPSPYGGNNYAGTSFDIPAGGNSVMKRVGASQAVPGDVVVFPNHIALYVGKGKAISMGQNGDPIVISVSAEGAFENRGVQGYYHMRSVPVHVTKNTTIPAAHTVHTSSTENVINKTVNYKPITTPTISVPKMPTLQPASVQAAAVSQATKTTQPTTQPAAQPSSALAQPTPSQGFESTPLAPTTVNPVLKSPDLEASSKVAVKDPTLKLPPIIRLPKVA